ncbi:hypothetical protein SAMN02745121_00850 [Nannocystis exedens]|uniref:Uncharacterized protein n=1 Tax=Nannocystis exedens TaxID=54 RepID=A0A1I1TZT7_9BACT|nr:hypothetical protein NAEX_04384 [Nannocystis exedens]SFD64077.1 hypothetical protein SAMN02745121_00850 [Nannocystis exedens]
MGLRQELLPRDCAEGRALADRTGRRHFVACPEGQALRPAREDGAPGPGPRVRRNAGRVRALVRRRPRRRPPRRPFHPRALAAHRPLADVRPLRRPPRPCSARHPLGSPSYRAGRACVGRSRQPGSAGRRTCWTDLVNTWGSRRLPESALRRAPACRERLRPVDAPDLALLGRDGERPALAVVVVQQEVGRPAGLLAPRPAPGPPRPLAGTADEARSRRIRPAPADRLLLGLPALANTQARRDSLPASADEARSPDCQRPIHGRLFVRSSGPAVLASPADPIRRVAEPARAGARGGAVALSPLRLAPARPPPLLRRPARRPENLAAGVPAGMTGRTA